MTRDVSDNIQNAIAEASSRFELCASLINQREIKSFAEIGV